MSNFQQLDSPDSILEKLWLPVKDAESIERNFPGLKSDQIEKMAKSLELPGGQSEPDKRGEGTLQMAYEDQLVQAFGFDAGDTFSIQDLTRFQRAYNWIDALIGHMPYGWWLSGPVPNDQPAYAINQTVQSISYYRAREVFCAGVTNLFLRSVGKRVPTYGNKDWDGGTYAYSLYFRDFIRPFRLADVQPMDLIGRYFRHNSPDQGHVGIIVVLGGKKYVLQSFDGGWALEGYYNGPGLNQIFTPSESHEGGYYEWRVPAKDWINYAGDEPGFAAAA